MLVLLLRRRLPVLALDRRGVAVCRGTPVDLAVRRRCGRRAALGVPELGVQLQVGLLQRLLDLRQNHEFKHSRYSFYSEGSADYRFGNENVSKEA